MYNLNEIVELEEQINVYNNELNSIEEAKRLEIKTILDDCFNPFKEFKIRVNRESANFYLEDEEGNDKEVFNLNFYERYKEDAKLEISYYTTNRQSYFELKRLVVLGKVANRILDSKEFLEEEIKRINNKNKERIEELWGFKSNCSKKINEYQKANTEILKRNIEIALKSKEGISIPKGATIKLKANYAPKLDKIRIIKSKGKTCTVNFEMGEGSYNATESRVNIDSLIQSLASYF